MLTIEILQERISHSELGQEWVDHPLLNQDAWSVQELGYAEEESKIKGTRNIYFHNFSLPWLKLLAKLTILASSREKCSLGVIETRLYSLKQLDKFIIKEGYNNPELITDSLLQKFVTSGKKGTILNKQVTLVYITRLWAEEEWLRLLYTPAKYQKLKPKIETIPEEVLYQIYENFDMFPSPLERLFRLQLVLGCRIGEVLRMPRQCLKKEGNNWFLLRWIEKRKHWQFYQVHPLVAELVRKQQKFLDTQFGSNSDFEKLFCKASTANHDGAGQGKRFEIEPIYFPKLISTHVIGLWLRDFSEKANLRDKHGLRFNLKSHQFRRTKASIMAYCEAEDEYIAAVLGHGSLDMLPHYRQRSLDRLENVANTKGYVDMYGQVTTYKPKRRRCEKLAELLKVSTPLGECHRPTMLGDCQYRYACLSCDHHRVTLEDQPLLEADIQRLQQDLEQAQARGKERTVPEINRLLELLKNRLQGLKTLQNIKGNRLNG